MGSQDFATYQPGTDAKQAFAAAVEQAQYEYGHRGYTGTIAEKGFYGFTVIQAKPVSIDDARKLAAELVYTDPRVEDKWGPAGAIAVSGGPHTRQVTIKPRPGGYASFGKAIRANLGDLPEGVTFVREVGGSYEPDPRGRGVKSGSATVELTGGTAHTGWLFFGSAPS
jgi:hypothetical protein